MGPLEPFDPDLDHFARLGLMKVWVLERDELEDAYLDRSKRVHPDRFVNAEPALRRAALEHSAALNEAYATLRDPVRRAEYLVKLGGIDLDSSDPDTGAPHPSQVFLIEMIERRERLAELGDDLDALDALYDEVEDEADDAFNAAVRKLCGGNFTDAAAKLVHRRYLQRFLDEIDAARDQ